MENMPEYAVRAADGGASGIAALDDQQAWFAIRVPHVGVVHQVVGDGAHKWKQTILSSTLKVIHPLIGILSFPSSN
jgi:hypothetical protein